MEMKTSPEFISFLPDDRRNHIFTKVEILHIRLFTWQPDEDNILESQEQETTCRLFLYDFLSVFRKCDFETRLILAFK